MLLRGELVASVIKAVNSFQCFRTENKDQLCQNVNLCSLKLSVGANSLPWATTLQHFSRVYSVIFLLNELKRKKTKQNNLGFVVLTFSSCPQQFLWGGLMATKFGIERQKVLLVPGVAVILAAASRTVFAKWISEYKNLKITRRQ